jgi:hypothetical protein
LALNRSVARFAAVDSDAAGELEIKAAAEKRFVAG